MSSFFTYPEIDPVLFHIWILPIRWYALAYIAGLLLGWYYIASLMKNTKLWQGSIIGTAPAGPPISKEKFDDILFWITLGVILGGRLGYVLFYEPALLTKAWDPFPPALKIWEGGMSFHGGLIGVTVAGYFYSKKESLNALAIGDLFACAAPIGLFFGRVANFINAELVGRPTESAVGIIFPSYFNHAADQWVYAAEAVARHPSQLYEAALEGIVLFFVIRLATHTYGVLRKPGFTIGLFLAGYGISRIIVENFREPDFGMPEFPFGLTMGMLLSTPMVILGGYLIWRAQGQYLTITEKGEATRTSQKMSAPKNAANSREEKSIERPHTKK